MQVSYKRPMNWCASEEQGEGVYGDVLAYRETGVDQAPEMGTKGRAHIKKWRVTVL